MKKYMLFHLFLLVTSTAFCQTYTFTGNGYWSNSSNWSLSQLPPAVLPAGDTIYISPKPGDSCVLDVPQKILPGSSLIISAGANFIVSGNLDSYSIPVLTTSPVTAIMANSASGGGVIISDGGSAVTERGLVWSVNPAPIISNSKTSEGPGSGNFTSHLSDLSFNTRYYVKAYAKNSTGIAYGNEISFTTIQPPSTIICNQEWTTINLAVTTYRNGDSIPQITNAQQWDTMTTGGWCYYGFVVGNNYGSEYGKWYNRYAIMDARGLAPAGWHIPCDVEWETLSSCVGNAETAGAALKEAGTTHWVSPNSATNSSGFTALGAGLYIPHCSTAPACWGYEGGLAGNTYIESFKNYGAWWSTTESSVTNGKAWYTIYYSDALGNSNTVKFSALSVRCIKGDSSLVCSNTLPVVKTDSVRSIAHNSAVFFGTVPNSNVFLVTERGFVWDTLASPTTASNHDTSGSGIGSYSLAVQGLKASKLYHVRAYVTNQNGTAYGPEVSFTTLPPQLPVVKTLTLSNDHSTAVCGGRVTDDGESAILTRGFVWSTSPNPTIAGNSLAGTGTAPDFTATITGLLPNTIYYLRTYTSNAIGLSYGNEITINTTNSLPQSVAICNDIWTQKNLTVSTYRNGDPIPQVTDQTAWANLTTGAWCWYNNDSATYAATYGKLYNWYAVNDPRQLAPVGMHIPSLSEWTSFFNCLGGSNAAASNAVREVGTSHWQPNTGATNSTGFTALPAGYRKTEGFINLNKSAIWWSSRPDDYPGYSNCTEIMNGYSFRYAVPRTNGLSIRCVRD